MKSPLSEKVGTKQLDVNKSVYTYVHGLNCLSPGMKNM